MNSRDYGLCLPASLTMPDSTWQTVGVLSIYFERMNVNNDGDGGDDEAISSGQPTGTIQFLIPLPGIQ